MRKCIIFIALTNKKEKKLMPYFIDPIRLSVKNGGSFIFCSTILKEFSVVFYIDTSK